MNLTCEVSSNFYEVRLELSDVSNLIRIFFPSQHNVDFQLVYVFMVLRVMVLFTIDSLFDEKTCPRQSFYFLISILERGGTSNIKWLQQ